MHSEDGNLWLVDPSKREFISLEKAEVPQGYGIQSSAISPTANYIALLFRSRRRKQKERAPIPDGCQERYKRRADASLRTLILSSTSKATPNSDR